MCAYVRSCVTVLDSCIHTGVVVYVCTCLTILEMHGVYVCTCAFMYHCTRQLYIYTQVRWCMCVCGLYVYIKSTSMWLCKVNVQLLLIPAHFISVYLM